MWKNVHLVYGAEIRTRNLLNMSLLLQPLDQGSRSDRFLYLIPLLSCLSLLA